MSEDSDRSQKTEEATPRRLLEAREKGQVMTSQEVSHLAVMIGGAFIAGFLGPFLAYKILGISGGLLQNFHAIRVDAANIGNVAFLEPLIVIIPSSVFPPRIDILSITI